MRITPRPRARSAVSAALALFLIAAGVAAGPASATADTPAPAPEPAPAPAVTISKSTGLDPAGEVITINGSGFTPSTGPIGTRPPLAGQPSGAYVVFGKFAETWKPSAGAPTTARPVTQQVWAMPDPSHATMNPDGTNAAYTLIAADGTFQVQLRVSDTATNPTGNYGIYTYPGSGAAFADYETYTPLTFAVPTPVAPAPVPEPQPAIPAAPEPPAAAGGVLSWSVSAGFSSYITGPTAHGAIETRGGATRSGGLFHFGQAAGSSYDPTTGLGTVAYTGTVRFTGHGGGLDVSVANPEFRFTAPGSAELWVGGGTRLHLATVNVAAATRTTSGSAVTFSGAPVTLTSAGRALFLGNYSSLDALTVTIGSASSAPPGATGTIATAAVAAQRSIPAAPPASTGITVDAGTLGALGGGHEVTIAVDGFRPNETDIAVVVYSTPTVLSRSLTADASGVATWTGTLPAGLEDGEHTLTFQGSVARGILFTLARTASGADTCAVAGATLTWGLKESFRSYVEGIAHGGWELEGVEYAFPAFAWKGGTGTLEPEPLRSTVDFGGAIRFTGHGGALDTTLRNARVELNGTTGQLVFDVVGETRDGQAMDLAGVRFATFEIPPGALRVDGLTLDEVATTFTPEGAEAFGTYPAGERLDPLSLFLPTSTECAGSPADGEPNDGAVALSTAAERDDSTGGSPLPWIIGGGAGLLLVAAAGLLIARRATSRRASVTPTT